MYKTRINPLTISVGKFVCGQTHSAKLINRTEVDIHAKMSFSSGQCHDKKPGEGKAKFRASLTSTTNAEE
jgi:hypothetical protein